MRRCRVPRAFSQRPAPPLLGVAATILHSLFIFPDICYTLLFTIRQEISELQSLPPTASYRYFTKEQKMCLGTFLRLRRSLATSTLYAAVRILAERFLLYRKAISCKVKKRCQKHVSVFLTSSPTARTIALFYPYCKGIFKSINYFLFFC